MKLFTVRAIPPKLARIYDVVRCAQQAGIAAIRPGVSGGRAAATALATRAAAIPAENPLSIFETVTPGAQEFSMASKAASPWKLAP